MDEDWLQAQVYISKLDSKNTVLLEGINGCIRDLKQRGLIHYFHFLFEPPVSDEEVRMVLRLRLVDKEKTPAVRTLVQQHLDRTRACFHRPPLFQYDYRGEIPNYGEEGWALAQRFFECASEFSLAFKEAQHSISATGAEKDSVLSRWKIPQPGDRDLYFATEKFVHIFLNANSMNLENEAAFHLDRFIERLYSLGFSDENIAQRFEQHAQRFRQLQSQAR